MNTIEMLVERIEKKIAEGSNTLNNSSLRMEIHEILRPKAESRIPQMSAEELMVELTKGLIARWPLAPSLAFLQILERLPPLKNIAVILDPVEMNKCVHLRDNPCVMEDVRTSLEDFKKMLWEQLFEKERIATE